MASANPKPPPAAAPLMAAIKTVEEVRILSNKECKEVVISSTIWPISPESIASANSLIGPPALKNLPFPVNITEEQVLSIAHELKDSDVSIFRAGIWKPRTRPGMFEGVGAIGLKWLKKVKQETGLLTTTEVANANHVKLAIENDIDVLWIGARST